jgi:hypothetical protein
MVKVRSEITQAHFIRELAEIAGAQASPKSESWDWTDWLLHDVHVHGEY